MFIELVNEETEQMFSWTLSVISSQSSESLLRHDASGIAENTKMIIAGVGRDIVD
jgi:hypothetical protein